MDQEFPISKAYSACPHDCPSTCALEVELPDQQHIGRVRGAKSNSYTSGIVCAKVARYAERTHHPDRLTTPMRRTGEKGTGEFSPLSWDDALDEVANSFVKTTQQHGSESVWPYYYAGTMGLLQRDGINRLRHSMKYSGQHSTICVTLVRAGWGAGVGAFLGPDPREMGLSDLIVSWGGNPASTQVNAMTHIQKARKTRGAKLVVVDPYLTRTAQVADMHLAIRPGTDGALACAMMHILFRDGYADRAYMEKYSDCPKRLKEHLKDRTPEWAAQITGLATDQIEEFAQLYGSTRRSYIRVGYGFSRSRNGAVNTHAVSCLPTITGAWTEMGGGAFYTNGDIYHWDKTLIEGLDQRDTSIRMLDQCRIGPILTGDKTDLVDGPPVNAMLVQNTNPAVVAPETTKVLKGLSRDDLFFCVHEQFMTDTALYADILLPATTFVEHNDIYQAGGHQHIILGPRLIEPVGQSRSNHRVICDLANRLGANHRGFKMTEEEIIDDTLKTSGWGDIDKLRNNNWIDCQPSFEASHFLNGFPNKDGKFRFSPDWSTQGPNHSELPDLPDHVDLIEKTDEAHPFRLVTAPSHNYLNTSFTETATSTEKEVRPTVKLCSADAAANNFKEGNRVKVGNHRGEIIVHVEIGNAQQTGIAVIEGIWPNKSFENGIGVNALIGADAGPPNGGGVFHDAAVWIKAS